MHVTCIRAINKKKQLAYLLNCSNGNFTKNVKKLYFAVLKNKTHTKCKTDMQVIETVFYRLA